MTLAYADDSLRVLQTSGGTLVQVREDRLPALLLTPAPAPAPAAAPTATLAKAQ